MKKKNDKNSAVITQIYDGIKRKPSKRRLRKTYEKKKIITLDEVFNIKL